MMRAVYLLLCASTLSLAAAAARGQAAKPDDHPTLIVSGHGETQARPDVVHVTVGVVTEAKLARDAARANADLADRVMKALRQQGIAEKDLQTSSYNVQPRYENQPNRNPNIVGYQVTNQVRATVRKLDTVGDVIDAALAAGANNVESVSFALEARAEPEARALAEAVRDARRKAEALAQAANMRIVRVDRIQAEGAGGPQPIMEAKMAFAARAATPISPGELTVETSVQITYRIEPTGAP